MTDSGITRQVVVKSPSLIGAIAMLWLGGSSLMIKSMGSHGFSQSTPFRRNWQRSGLERGCGKAAHRLREQVTLHQLDPGSAACGAFRWGFDALGHDTAAELPTQCRDRRDDPLLGRLPIELANQRHIELDEFGL